MISQKSAGARTTLLWMIFRHSMLCIFIRHGRREKEEADDEGRHAEERSGIADVSDSRIRADDAKIDDGIAMQT